MPTTAFSQSGKKRLVSMQTASPPLHLPTSDTLPTIFFVEQAPMASVLTQHLPFPPPPKDHRTALQEPHSILLSHIQSLCTHAGLFIQYYLQKASRTWNINSMTL